MHIDILEEYSLRERPAINTSFFMNSS